MAPKSRSGIIRQIVGPIRSRLINNISAANKLIAFQPVEVESGQKLIDDITELSAKLSNGIASLSERDQQWQNLILSLNEDEAPAEEEIYAKVALDEKEGYQGAVEYAKDVICRLDRKGVETKRQIDNLTRPAVSDNASAASKATAAPSPQGTAKLPKLVLPTFDGDFLDWPNFWSIFSRNVHERSISGAEKFAYLLGQLTGTALQTIEGIAVTDNNYEPAITALKQRFERSTSELVGSLYSQLKRLPKSSDKVSDLTKTFDGCEKIFRQLESAGEDVDNNRSMVIDVLSKYPSTMVADLMQYRNIGKHSTLKEIRAALRLHIRKSEDFVELLQELSPFGESCVGSKTRPRQDVSTAVETYGAVKSGSSVASSALTTVSTSRNVPKSGTGLSRPLSPCYFCRGKHFNSQCTVYDTCEKRCVRLGEIGRCVRCLGEGHIISNCPMPNQRLRCFFCNQNGEHPSPLCPKQFGSAKPGGGANNEVKNTQPNSLAALAGDNTAMASVGEVSYLPTAVATVFGGTTDVSAKARILFDTGSNRSYITEGYARELNLQTVSDEAMHVAVFGTTRTLSVDSRVVSFQLEQRDGSVKQIRAHTTPVITSCAMPPGRLPSIDAEMIGRMGYSMAEPIGSMIGRIDILIGSDLFWEFVSGPKIETPSGLFLIPSTLGYVLGGQCGGESSTPSSTTLLCLTETFGHGSRLGCGLSVSKNPFGRAQPDLEEFWLLEKIGITDDPVTKDDDIALKKFTDSIYFSEGRYQVKWPWKDNADKLPTNYDLAVGRFRSLAKRLRADPVILSKYNDVITQQLNDGIIELVPKNEVNTGSSLVHYLPHHPIVKPSSATTKVRIVYDASAKTRRDNPSLNECLYRGPVLLPDLCGLLLRFRLHNVAVIADVEKAFLQMSLQPDDRNVTCFLWFADPSTPTVDGNMTVYRFKRVPFGIISSPFLLNGTILHHLKQYDNWIARRVESDIYVDNLATGCESEQDAKEVYDRTKQMFLEAGMNMQEWCSSSDVLLEYVPQPDLSKQRTMKVLGMSWDSINDTLKLNHSPFEMPEKINKRYVLHTVASMYDPLGLFQPVFVKAKRFLQVLWQKKTSWDESLSAEDREEMIRLNEDIKPVFEIAIPRNPDAGMDTNIADIVVFCDASKIAYAAAVYLRRWDAVASKFTSSLVYAKSRLSPAKKGAEISLPRLELLGVTIGSRAGKFVRNSLARPQLPIYIMTDSQCVLFWIQNEKPLSVFVENRVRELKSMPNTEFGYVKTGDNPADLCTRGVTAMDLEHSSKWWKGPQWLTNPTTHWDSKCEFEMQQLAAATAELRKSQVLHHTLLAAEDPNQQPCILGIDIDRYSSFRKLKRVSVWCLKFLKKIIWDRISVERRERFPSIGAMFKDVSDDPYITRSELNRVKVMWVKSIQQQQFSDVSTYLADPQRQRRHRGHHLVRQLGLGFDEEGILRCYGRFEHADLPTEAMQPKLLPKVSTLTDMIIRDTHERLLHAGIAHTLSQIRREFWIPQGRMAVRKVVKRCLLCRKYTGGPFALPLMPPWPRERLSPSSPFRFVGLDYLGPINIKMGTENQKAWVCLFTCLSVRAVHLEWVLDCSAQEFLDCVTRFISRRGTPDRIISDNAPQFRVVKSAFDRIWHSTLTNPDVISYAADKGIEWTFITELAPWQGGFYERLVALVKRAFRFAVGRRLLQCNEFMTLCCEVEALVNSRPITYLHSDLDSGKPLRPIDFLTDNPVGTPESQIRFDVKDFGEAGRHLLQYWKFKQGKLRSLWELWHNEYLLSLRERGSAQHRRHRGAVHSVPIVGDVVLIKDSDAPRGAWKLGRVTCINQSSDGAVRSASVEMHNKVTLRRSVDHLYPIEVPISQSNLDEEEDFYGFTEEEVNEAIARVRNTADDISSASNVEVAENGST